MRLPFIVLLALAAVVSDGASAITTTIARFTLVNRDDAPTKRLLRSDAAARVDGNDDGEERVGILDGLVKLFNPSSALTPAQRQVAGLAKLANKDLTKAFKSLKLNKFKSVKVKKLNLEDVDKLFTGEKYKLWAIHMGRWNKQQPIENRYNVAKMFNQELGSEKAFKVFNIASTSANPTVKTMGDNFQVQLLRQVANAGDDYTKIHSIVGSDEAAVKWFNLALQSTSKRDQEAGKRAAAPFLRKWAKEGKTHGDVVNMSPSLGDQYTNMLISMAAGANRRESDLVRAAGRSVITTRV
ncbi:hypothetical protein PHMEG_00026657 [Phytophthora megakarya]|uniref:RxLR effector protein n=1 Tax=Phytophthora megakarya TaxID=4795 RepID=A0A225V935_9STRA|nr:hypothetical protein PHMEG_00026657 [Phytophthora megakarya]